MSFNLLVFIGVVIFEYVLGALWYSLFFGKQWLKINHPAGLPSKLEMQNLAKKATPYYGIQLFLTIVSAWVQWFFVSLQPTNWFKVSIFIWAGFMVPTLIQSVIWSDPKNNHKLLQIAIVSLNFLVNLIIAGWLFVTFG